MICVHITCYICHSHFVFACNDVKSIIVDSLKVIFIYIITGGLFWIFLRWFPKVHMNLNRTKAKIENSDFLLIRNIEYNQYYKSKIGTIDSKLVEKCFKITSVTDQLLTFEFIKRKFVILDYCLG